MKPAIQDIAAHNAHEWKRLEFLLRQRKRPTILWVSCDTYPNRQATFEEMKRRLTPQFQPHALSLETSAMSLTRYLQERLPAEVLASEPGQWMVHLFDLEGQLAQRGEEEGAGLMASLNFERETLFRSFPFILVIWATPLATRRVQREAPDFWDWIANRFEFFY
jgi:hypothetical protein